MFVLTGNIVPKTPIAVTNKYRKKQKNIPFTFVYSINDVRFSECLCRYDIDMFKNPEKTELLILRTHNHCLHTDTLSSLYNDRGASVIFANIFDEIAEAFPRDQITRLQDLVECKSIAFCVFAET